jgi:short-subunit dehydrogenase
MTLRLPSLTDQIVVITGASSGIGLVTARMAADRGATVVLAARNERALDELADQITTAGGCALVVPTDVGSEEQVDRLAERALERFGRIDTWVNNAGISIFGEIMDVSTEDMRRMFDVVYWGVVYGCRAAVRHFRDAGHPGAIINVGSLFGDRATPLQSTYASAKHAVHGFTEALRMELEAAGDPVSVTLLHPGRIDTPYNEHAQAYTDRRPVHRVMVYEPDAVAEAILHAAEYPVRDLYIGSQAKALAIVGRLAPRLTDKAMERYLYWGQLDPDHPAQRREESALYQPGRLAGQATGTHRGWKRSSSLYLRGQQHRRIRDGLIAGVGGSLLAAGLRRR